VENLDAIDPPAISSRAYPKVPSDKYINEFKRRAFVLGLDISGTGVRNSGFELVRIAGRCTTRSLYT
jgi:hypothetical protein